MLTVKWLQGKISSLTVFWVILAIYKITFELKEN